MDDTDVQRHRQPAPIAGEHGPVARPAAAGGRSPTPEPRNRRSPTQGMSGTGRKRQRAGDRRPRMLERTTVIGFIVAGLVIGDRVRAGRRPARVPDGGRPGVGRRPAHRCAHRGGSAADHDLPPPRDRDQLTWDRDGGRADGDDRRCDRPAWRARERVGHTGWPRGGGPRRANRPGPVQAARRITCTFAARQKRGTRVRLSRNRHTLAGVVHGRVVRMRARRALRSGRYVLTITRGRGLCASVTRRAVKL